MRLLDRVRWGLLRRRWIAASGALFAVVLLALILGLAMRGASAVKGEQLAWNSPELQEAGQLLRASGCEVWIASDMSQTSLLGGISDFLPLPQIIEQAFSTSKQTFEYGICADGSQLTAENLAIFDRYPMFHLELRGPDITDESLDKLTGSKHLIVLFVDATATTNEGLMKFHSARPEIGIFFGSRDKITGRFEPPVSAAPESQSQPQR